MDPSCTWPGSQPDDLRRTSGRHRCSRACEVHARYIAGGDVSHCDSSNQVTPNSSSKTAASPHGCPGLTNPADERSASRTRSARPQSVTVSRTVTPVISAPPSRPPALRENTGAAGRTQGEHARLGGASSRNKPPARPVRGRPWKPGGYTDRPGGPHAVRYASVDAATQHPTARQGDTSRDRAQTAP